MPTIVAGCDVGSLTTKAVAMYDKGILGYEIAPSKPDVVQSARDTMGSLLKKLNLSYQDIDYCVSTGYGRQIIPFADANLSEMSCHGKGARWLVPTIHTVIDGGGQDCKAILVNEKGDLRDFRINTKCAAGTGRALELMAESLGVDVSELGPLSLQACNPAVLRKPCCLMAQIEIRHLLLEGKDPPDIAAAICDYVAIRLRSLVRGLQVKKDIVFTGGVAKNIGVVACLERALGARFVHLPEDPQLVGAIGAAVHAAARADLPSFLTSPSDSEKNARSL